MSIALASTPMNRGPRQVSVQRMQARAHRRRGADNDHHDNNNNNNGSYLFTVRTPNGGPTVRLRVNLMNVIDGEPPRRRSPRLRVRPAAAAAAAGAVEDAEQSANSPRTTRSSARIRKRSMCNHALDRQFCSKCHIRRRHLNRWWLRQQYRQH